MIKEALSATFIKQQELFRINKIPSFKTKAK